MPNERLLNEWAEVVARGAVAVIRPCLRPEEVADALAELHRVAADGLLGYALAAARMRLRIDPLAAGE